MSNRELVDLAEQALFALGALLRDIAMGESDAAVIAKGERLMEKFELIRHDGKTRAEVQKKQDRGRRTYKPKLKLRKATS